MSNADQSDITAEEKVGLAVGRLFGLKLTTKERRLTAGIIALILATFACVFVFAFGLQFLIQTVDPWLYPTEDRYYESGDIEVRDTVDRNTGKVISRYATFKDGRRASGPMADGELHGEWVYMSKRFDISKEWYWYGEQITKGEWHLRAGHAGLEH